PLVVDRVLMVPAEHRDTRGASPTHPSVRSTTPPQPSTICYFPPPRGAAYSGATRVVSREIFTETAVTTRPGTGDPPEEVSKPDSGPPPNERGQQPFIWSPGCPGDRATDPRERAGHPRPASRPDLPPTRSCSGWGLPSIRPHGRIWRALTSPFHPCSGSEDPGRSAFCGTFPRSL